MQNVIQEVSSHKHLGLYFSNNCSWHQHINYIKQKAWFRFHFILKLKIKLDRKSLETIYLVFIRPLLEYRDVIWDNCTKYEKNELDKIQNEAARISTGTTKLMSLDNLYKEVGWQNLHLLLSPTPTPALTQIMSIASTMMLSQCFSKEKKKIIILASGKTW